MSRKGFTPQLLFTLAQMGFHIDILQFGMNVVIGTMEYGAELMAKRSGGRRGIRQMEVVANGEDEPATGGIF